MQSFFKVENFTNTNNTETKLLSGLKFVLKLLITKININY